MTFDYARIIALQRENKQQLTKRDTILYALGIGAGIDATSEEALTYCYEDGLKAFPTMAAVLATPGFWQREPEFSIAWNKILHGEQSVTFHRPLPTEGEITSLLTVENIYDKGADKGALLYSRRELTDAQGNPLATILQGSFLRGDGGVAGLKGGAPIPHSLPEGRAPDHTVVLRSRPEQALIYRLSGDYNPLHAHPGIAKQGGFDRPILHGLATYGFCGRAVVSALCGGDGNKLRQLNVRFSKPVFPGETIVTEIWRDGPTSASFRAKVEERDTIVLNNGYAEFN